MKAIRLIKFFFDAMYYQFFIFNRDKFRLENPHERTVMLFCGLLFLRKHPMKDVCYRRQIHHIFDSNINDQPL